jgi:hypothetical protein
LICGVYAQSDRRLSDAKQALNHANTYHWLARYKNSDSRDFLESKRWFELAVFLAKDDSSKEANKIRDIATAGIKESNIRYENNFDNIMNDYPLFQVLNGLNNTYELHDDPDAIAASVALENAMTPLVLTPPREDYQMMVIITSDPVNQALEDELHFTINKSGSYFYRPMEEQLDIVSQQEVESIYALPEDLSGLNALTKLGNAWNQRYLVNVKLIENDIVDDVYYFGAWFYLWDTDNGTLVKSVYADGFCEDRRYIKSQKSVMMLIALFLAFILPLAFKYLYSFIFRTDLRPIHLYTSLYAFAMTLGLHYPIISTFKTWAPAPETLTILPMNRLWIYTLVFTLAILPPILVYLIGTRVPGIRDRLSDGESITSLAAGTLLGNLTHLTLVHITRFSVEGLSYYYAFSVFTIMVTSLYIGVGISNKFHKGINRDLMSIPVYIFVAMLLMLSLLKNDYFYIILSTVAGVVTPVFAVSYNRIVEYIVGRKRRKITEDATFIDVLNNENYAEILNRPYNYIGPFPGQNMRKEVASHFTSLFDTSSNIKPEKKKLHTLLITGPAGCGKTRLAREIGRKVIDHYNSAHSISGDDSDAQNWVLFGDCDEMGQEGSGVPFEPFSQAMHEVLGAGRFEPPLKRANKIKAGFEKLGMDQAMDSVGFGVLNSILGSGSKSEEVTSATSTEMADIIEKTLVRLAENRPVVFIIDDTQWVDEATYALFNELLKKLVTIPDPPNIHIIITAIIETEGDGKSENKLVETLRTFGPNRLINLKEIGPDHFIGPSRFDEFLTRGLYFDSFSARQIALYLSKYEVGNITQVIQTVNQIFKENGIRFQKSQAFLKKSFQLEDMEPPSSAIAQVTQLLKTIAPEEKRVLECAAFIGTEFNATTLSHALNEDRLKVLVDLRRLENNGLINDVLDQDDVYRFSSSMILNGIRYVTSNAQTGSTENISQIVREYHFCVAEAIEKQFNISAQGQPDTSKIGDHTLYKLAKRSRAAGERMAEKALYYNIAAQNRAEKSSQYHDLIAFGHNVLTCVEKINISKLDITMIESIYSTMRGMIYTNTNPEKIKQFYHSANAILETQDADNKHSHLLRLKCLLTDAIIHDFSDSYVEEIEITKERISALIEQKRSSITPLNLVFAELSLYRLQEESKSPDQLYKLINQLESIGVPEDDTFLLRIKSEVIEDILKVNLRKIMSDDEKSINANEWYNLLQDGKHLKKEINDKEGLSQLHLLEGSYYLHQKKFKKASTAFDDALLFAKEVGSMDFASDAHTGLGKIDLMNENYHDALIKFSKATVESKIDDNIPNQYAALQGVFSAAVKLQDNEIIKEFSDEVTSLFVKDRKKESNNRYHDLVAIINECKSFSPDIQTLIP